MTREEVIEYWEQFNAEIDDLYDACSDADRDVLVKQREIVEYTISALRQQETVTKCNDLFEEDGWEILPKSKRNEPLTLDELRRMEGQPVYIVENTEYWAIVNSFDQVGVYLLSYGNPDDYGYFGFYGKTWLAYRQKPEEDDHDA